MPKGPKGRSPPLVWPPALEDWKSRPKRKNATDKRTAKAAAVQLFAKQYGRKAQKGVEPNDRRFDVKVEKSVKRMNPKYWINYCVMVTNRGASALCDVSLR
jgi:hypothetical protein